MTQKTDVWAKAKVVSEKTVREKQETGYLSDLLDRVEEIHPRVECSHEAGTTVHSNF